MSRKTKLPLSDRPVPAEPSWLMSPTFLLEAGHKSIKTETTYRSGLRLFADWVQQLNKGAYSLEDSWPLSPEHLSTELILSYRSWLIANRSRATVTTYTASLVAYLNFLDGQNMLPPTVQLGKLQRQLSRRQVDRNQAETVVDLDEARQDVPRIVTYYDQLPLPAPNEKYHPRLTILRNRAIVHTLYSTAARISEIVQLNRSNTKNGQSEFALIRGKGGKSRTVFIRAYAQRTIQAYLRERTDNNPALFISHSRNSNHARLTSTSVHNVVKKAVIALDLHPTLSAHDFRHFRATQLLREGMPIEVVQEFLGHADISTTRNIYAPVLGVHLISDWLDQVDVPPSKLTP